MARLLLLRCRVMMMLSRTAVIVLLACGVTAINASSAVADSAGKLRAASAPVALASMHAFSIDLGRLSPTAQRASWFLVGIGLAAVWQSRQARR